MKEIWKNVVLGIFLGGLVLAGLLGTSTSMTFVWPAYGVIALAGVLSAGLLFRKAGHSLPATTAVCGFVALVVLGALAWRSPVGYLARSDLALGAAAFLVYGLFLALLDSAKARHRFTEALALLVVANLGFALLQKAVQPTLWIVPGYERTFTDRVGGLFNHPDHFAAFLAMLAPLWTALAVLGRRPFAVRVGFATLAAASALVALASGGLAAAPGLLGGFAVLAAVAALLLRHRLGAGQRRKVLRGAVAVLGPAALLCLLCSGPLGRAIDRDLLSRAGAPNLPLVWQAGWRQFAESPLLGTGSRTYEIHARLHRHEALAADSEPEFAHNEYLQTLGDYGLLGFAALLAALAAHFVAGLRFVGAYACFGSGVGSLLPRSDHLALTVGALASLGALAGLSAFDFLLHLPIFALAAAGLLAALAVPDPMADALKPADPEGLLPVPVPLLAKRALVFGAALPLLLLATVFARSEYHYEMAKLAFEVEPHGYRHHRHLRAARALDGSNPWIFALGGHAQVASLRPDMAEPERRQALQQAAEQFERARRLHPRDPFAAVGHAAVLEALGRPQEALARLREARESAPFHGNLILAEAEHHLRNGRVIESEDAYRAAMNARAYRDTGAAQRGLRTLTEWKLIAESRGIDWRIPPDPVESEPLVAGTGKRGPTERRPTEATVETVAPAGRSEAQESEEALEAPEAPEQLPPAGGVGDGAAFSGR